MSTPLDPRVTKRRALETLAQVMTVASALAGIAFDTYLILTRQK